MQSICKPCNQTGLDVTVHEHDWGVVTPADKQRLIYVQTTDYIPRGPWEGIGVQALRWLCAGSANTSNWQPVINMLLQGLQLSADSCVKFEGDGT